MGFVTQNDLRRSSVAAGYTQWINRKRVRNVIYSGSMVYDAFYDHAFLGRRGTVGAELTLESNDRIGYSYGPARERISASFSIGPITIQPGDYTNRSHEFTFESNASRPISGIVNYSLIDYWSGERRQLLFSTNVHPTANLSVDFIYTHNTVDHPHGRLRHDDAQQPSPVCIHDRSVREVVHPVERPRREGVGERLGGLGVSARQRNLFRVRRDQGSLRSAHLASRNRILLAKWTYKFRF